MCKAWEEQKNEGREEGRIRQAKVTALKLQKKRSLNRRYS